MTTSPHVPVRCSAVAIAVLRGIGQETKVLLLQRGVGSYAGEWCLITGRIEANEAPWATAVREVQEEAGFRLQALYNVGYCDSFYAPASQSLELVPVFVGVAPPDGAVTLNEENIGARWVTVGEAIDLVPFHGHRIALDAVRRDFIARPAPDWRRVLQFQP